MEILDQENILSKTLIFSILNDVYKHIEEYNSRKKRKALIVFDDKVADMISNNKLDPIVSELFIRSRKSNISLVLLRNHILKHQKTLA